MREAEVSRKHCVFRQKGGVYTLEDLGSALGTQRERRADQGARAEIRRRGRGGLAQDQVRADGESGEARCERALRVAAQGIQRARRPANAEGGRTMMAIDLNDSMAGNAADAAEGAAHARGVARWQPRGRRRAGSVRRRPRARRSRAASAISTRRSPTSTTGSGRPRSRLPRPRRARRLPRRARRFRRRSRPRCRAPRRPATCACSSCSRSRGRPRRSRRSGRGARQADPGLSAHAMREGPAHASYAVRRAGRCRRRPRCPRAETRTRTRPSSTTPSSFAAACERSITRPRSNGPRSLIRTSHRAAGREVLHRGADVERQRAVRGGERALGVEALAIRGRAAVEFSAVPGRDADLLVALPLLERHVGAAAHAVGLEAAERCGRSCRGWRSPRTGASPRARARAPAPASRRAALRVLRSRSVTRSRASRGYRNDTGRRRARVCDRCHKISAQASRALYNGCAFTASQLFAWPNRREDPPWISDGEARRPR